MKNKNKFARINALLLFFALSFSFFSCKKNKLPIVYTEAYSTISPSSVELNGAVSLDGGQDIVDRGFVYGKMEKPTIEDGKPISVEGGVGEFSAVLEDLEYNTFYYYRAYAQNKNGIAYGETVLILTKGFPYTAASCNPQTNWALFNNQGMNYYTTANVYSVGYNWTIRGNSTYSDLNIHFSQEPITGNYLTVNLTSDIHDQECEVSGVFGIGLGYFYAAEAGDTVHVTNDGNGHFSMSFCGLTFHSGSTTYVFSTDGNLTNL